VRLAAAATAAAVATLAATIGHAPVGVALGLCVVVAFAEPTFSGGISAAADRTLTGDAARSVHAWDSFSYNVAGLLAPALVAVTVAVSDAAVAAAALASAVVLGAVTSLGLRTEPVGRHDDAAPARLGIRSALATIWRSPPLRAVTVATTLAYVGTGGLTFAAVAGARAAERTPDDAGQLFTVLAIGGLAGSWLMTRRAAPDRPEQMVAHTLVAMGVVLSVMAATDWWAAMLVGAALIGLLDGPLLVGLFAARIAGASAEVRATVFTVGASAKLGASALGAILGGQLLGGRATTAGFALVGLAHLAAGALAWRSARPPAGVAR
jgi:hypothetical protein